MTIARFLKGYAKFIINLMIILVVGTSAYFIYGEITTLPPEATALDLEPEGTSFGVDPARFLGEDGIGKILSGDYFVDSESGMGPVVMRDAIENGLTYYPYDFSYKLVAEDIYHNTELTGINLWIGSWPDDNNILRGLGARISEKHGGKTYFEVFGESFDSYEYDVTGTVPQKDGDGNVRRDDKGDIIYNKVRHPKIEDGRLIAPTYHFTDLEDMKEKLYNDLDKEDADMVIAYWYLRVGSQVDSYVKVRARRNSGGGGGSGGMQGINLQGDLLLTSIVFQYYGYWLEKNVTIITGANAKVGLQILGPLLSVADFKLSGWRGEPDAEDSEEIWRFTTGKAARQKLSSRAYEGPNGVYVAEGDKKGKLPDLAELQALYDDYTPARRVLKEPDEEDEPNTEADIENINLCEFGMPASTFSYHNIDFRSIKTVEFRDGVDARGDKYYGAEFECYSSSDGPEWDFVSGESARGIASGIGGMAPEGPVGYLIYTKLTARFTVWGCGLMRTWGTQEDWDASLAGLIEAKVKANTNESYSYDINDILKDSRGLGISLPDQIKEIAKITD